MRRLERSVTYRPRVPRALRALVVLVLVAVVGYVAISWLSLIHI